MGRPQKDIDGETVRKLAKLGCNQDEIAEFFGVTQSVVSERFRSDFHLGSAESKISIRRMQFKRAMQGSDRMLIHLGKVYLGQTDRLDVTSKGKPTVVYIEAAENPRDTAEIDGWARERVRALNDRQERANRANGAALPFDDDEFGDATVVVLPANDSGKPQNKCDAIKKHRADRLMNARVGVATRPAMLAADHNVRTSSLEGEKSYARNCVSPARALDHVGCSLSVSGTGPSHGDDQTTQSRRSLEAERSR